MSVTTGTIWVCSRCGFVSHLDGHAPTYGEVLCPVSLGKLHAEGTTTEIGERYERHALKTVLVVVPYA